MNEEMILNEVEEIEDIPVETTELEIPEEKTSNGGAIIVAALAIYGGYKLGKKGGKLAVKGVKKGVKFVKEHFSKNPEEETEIEVIEVVDSDEN